MMDKEELKKYCNQTITIPPELPGILKEYARTAVHTQPEDLLKWSGSYFRSVANGESPSVAPAKDRKDDPKK